MKNQRENVTKTSLLSVLSLLNEVEFLKSVSQSKTLLLMTIISLVIGVSFVLFLFKMAGV